MLKRNSFRQKIKRPVSKTSWNPVADWYIDHLKEGGEFQRTIIFPGAIRLLEPKPRGTYLDIACGEGAFIRLAAKTHPQATFTGIDASPILVQHAQSQILKGMRFTIADATNFAHFFPPQTFDGATCLMAIQNIEQIEAVFRDAARVLKPGGSLVLVMNHPCFRQPRQSGWGWDEQRKLQYRRVDRYLSPYEMPILAHPGSAPDVKTTSFHRSLTAYVEALAKHGFAITALEEWTSHKQSDSGPRAKAENVARQEIPLFLAMRVEREA